jgi:hypothetical protein
VVRVKKEYSDEFKTLKNKKQRELFVKSFMRQGKVIVEDVDTNGVTQIPITTPTLTLNTPTDAYINELQGALV